MSGSFQQGFWQRVHGWLGSQTHHDLEDGLLLERFLADRDEAAFRVLLERHGPMVWNVCSRVLSHRQDAEDAFQATFLVLLRRAEAIRTRGSVGSWLHGVALRTAQKARGRAAQRHLLESGTLVADALPARIEQASENDPVLEEELARLPDKYRLPLLLCYYQGQTLEHAAQSLGWPLGTIAGRMSRAREQLRRRLQRRGIILAVPAVAAMLAERATAAMISPSLITQTVQSCRDWLSPEKTVPTVVYSLSQGVLQAMFWSKIKATTIVVLFLGLLGLGSGLLFKHAWARDPIVHGTPTDQEASGEGIPPGRKFDRVPVVGPSPKWKELAKRKLEVAREEWRLRQAEFMKIGRYDIQLLFGTSQRILEAELEVLENKADRVAAIERHLEVTRGVLARQKALYESGRVARQDVLTSEYLCLDVEMRLVKEKGE